MDCFNEGVEVRSRMGKYIPFFADAYEKKGLYSVGGMALRLQGERLKQEVHN